MTKAVLIMDGPEGQPLASLTPNRHKAVSWIIRAPPGTRVQFQGPQRSIDQNAKLHAMLSEMAAALEYYGQKRTVTVWKYLFMDALSRECEILPNLDGNGFVSIGRSTSDLSVAQMSDLIEIVYRYAAQHNFTFKNEPPPPEPQK